MQNAHYRFSLRGNRIRIFRPSGGYICGLNRFPWLTPGATVQRPLCGHAHGPDI